MKSSSSFRHVVHLAVTDSPMPPMVSNGKLNDKSSNNTSSSSMPPLVLSQLEHTDETIQLRQRTNNPYLLSVNTTTPSTPSSRTHTSIMESTSSKQISCFRHPLVTCYYFVGACILYAKYMWKLIVTYSVAAIIGVIALFIVSVAIQLNDSLSQLWNIVWSYLSFLIWWVGLGILSSVGLGTGLHTFVIYLAPHIAHVTIVATTCKTLDFTTSGIHQFQCRPSALKREITMFGVWTKVWSPAILWGVGTALGELPPYFVARAVRRAKISSHDSDHVSAETSYNYELVDDAAEKSADKSESSTLSSWWYQWYAKWKEWLEKRVGSALRVYGFWAILVFASIPNPLFDLAGLMCGHSGIALGTFFGATLIGKAFVKVTIQTVFIIAIFTEEHLFTLVDVIEHVVPMSRGALKDAFEAYKRKLQQGGSSVEHGPMSWLQVVWQSFLVIIVLFFVVSIVESVAHHFVNRRLSQQSIRVAD